MKLIQLILLGYLLQISLELNAQYSMLETLENEQVNIQMAISIQEQIIQCFDDSIQSSFEYNFRIHNGHLQTILRSDRVLGFDININIHTDEAALHLKPNSWTVIFGKLTVSFREWYLDENLELKAKIMFILKQEKERYENDYYLNKRPKKPAIIYNNLAYFQFAEHIFNDLIAIDRRSYDLNIGSSNIYLDTYKDRFIMHARWMDGRARGFSKNYKLGDLSITFKDCPDKIDKPFKELLNIELSTSGDSANEIKEAIQQMINSRKQSFLKKTKQE